ncbi:MAG TPA: PBP1A family penicillin-binding protein [Terriglobales bacterium]|nr:PBP1A family penicillin-binding protein [Terriglobales bacterium]
MAIKIRIPRKAASKSSPKTGKKRRSDFHLGDPIVKIAVGAFLLISLAFLGVFAFYYVRYDKIITHKMRGPIFNNSAKIYARPEVVREGEGYGIDDLVAKLKRAGYTEEGRKPESPWGQYKLVGDNAIQIMPGPQSFHSPDAALIRVKGDKISSITSAGEKGGQDLDGYELEPQLVTALFEGEQRTKRQLVTFNEIPKVMVNAVVAIEDRRFFQHSGVNFYRLIEAAVIDLREHGRQQGASTITMQISRGFFLTPQKTIKRKLTEMLIAIELEQKFTKEQIFELYANQVYMGQRGSYSINGFGEAARAYFNKDVRNLSLPEAATLAGIIQSPNYYNPYKRPERVVDRRNTVLDSMVETGAITRAQGDEAKRTPLKLAPPNVEASDAPYFVDLVKDQLQGKFPENELNDGGLRIYTTIDPQLQHAAAEAVQVGLKEVDEQVRKQHTKRIRVGKGKSAKYETQVDQNINYPQVALVAMDPHTGDILAMVGGRNYAFSQLNHAVAQRPTGSIFKPFVYATALNTAINDTPPDQVITASSTVDDSPSTFTYGDQIYEPRNYKNEYHGTVSLRYALMESLNNATVKVAETVGYDKVADLARAAGITSVKPTPAMALGAYDASPLEMAAAYTVFANGGTRLDPLVVHSVRSANGDVLQDFQTDSRHVLDPRISYLMTSMMEGVINNGTGFTVRQRGFTAPAAGKTGTSHDSWFAGYTSNLLCIVWVGYDDYSDLRLAGGSTAAPIWAEFMKRAVALPQYHDVQDFSQPSGVVDVAIDKITNRLSTAACPDHYEMAFISGTEPQATCEQTDNRNVFQKILGLGQPNPSIPVITGGQPRLSQPPNGHQPSPPVNQQAQQQPVQPEQKKKGFFGKLKDIFGGGGDDKKDQQNPHQ